MDLRLLTEQPGAKRGFKSGSMEQVTPGDCCPLPFGIGVEDEPTSLPGRCGYHDSSTGWPPAAGVRDRPDQSKEAVLRAALRVPLSRNWPPNT